MMSPPPTQRNSTERWPARADGEPSQQGPALQAAAAAVGRWHAQQGPVPPGQQRGPETAAGKGRSCVRRGCGGEGCTGSSGEENEWHGGRPTPAGMGRTRSLVRAAPRTAHEVRRHARLPDRAGVANGPVRGKGHRRLSRGGDPIF